MLRPATPLTIVLFISFVLLLLSVLSTPIIPSIPLAAFEGVNFGVFGYCRGNDCSGIKVGYTTDELFPNGDDGDWNLPSGTRNSLSSLLIVHPVAAFLNLIALGLAAAAHFHSPSHSARYLLGLFVILLPTLLVTLLAFLVDILLFVPHVQWGGWIVLGSTILITASGVITCAMRRTLVSRKARKKRIAENAEMSGENFYNRQVQETKLPTAPTFSTTESKPPMVNGAPGADNLPSFATFDSSRRNEDDRQPLAPQATNSISPVASRDDASSRYYNPPSRSNSRPPPRDQYGNPMPLGEGPGAFGPIHERARNDRGPSGPYRDGMGPPRGGYGPRGRGGYPPRGGYGPRGPPSQGYGRGGYPNRGRGGYPPPGAMAAAAGGAMMAGGMGRPPRQPPPGYGQPPADVAPERYGPVKDANPISPSIYSAHPNEYEAYGAGAQSPGRGQASPYGGRAQSPGGSRFRQPSPPPAMPALQARPVAEMDGRDPNPAPIQEEYIPPRANWDNNQGGPPPQNYRGPPPAELASSDSQLVGYGGPRRPRVNSGGSDVYYEDVDPRFATESMPPVPPPGGQPVPQVLTPGGGAYHDESPDSLTNRPPPMTNSYEDLPGARSPAESEDTNFTSVSQRGVNPNWRPGHGGEFNNLAPMRRPPGPQATQRRDVLLAGNPDFEIPGMGPSRRGGRGAFRGGGMGPGPGRMPPPASNLGMTANGPYPRSPPPMASDVREI